MRHGLIAVVLLLPLAATPGQESNPFLEKYVNQAQQLRAEGKHAEALVAVNRALERDHRSLRALLLRAQLAQDLGDSDTAVHSMHGWTDIVASVRPAPVPAAERRTMAESLLELDTEALTWARLQKKYVRELMSLGKDYLKKKDMLAALEVYGHVLEVDPHLRAARTAMRNVRRTGGREVAVEDVYAGADPTFGKTQEQVEREDALHSEWANAWKKGTDNYRYRTNAGFLVLETSAIAMEQMNRFYRKFFRYKLDGGKTPKIEIRIFKNRDEYLELGQSPAEWSAGHFIGSAVETFVGGSTGKESIRSMYGTLFHEAAHQFVSMTGPLVPGWLNEAYASFFEGCVILSNGSVDWNRVPPGRLFPLAQRMERGWMSGPDDGVRDSNGEWATPERAPTFRQVVENEYRWGPPWYAPTWGVVYFLYNYRAEDGRTVYRDTLHDYFLSFKRGRPKDAAANFEEIVLAPAELSPVQDLDSLTEIWRKWILRLRDRQTGKLTAEGELVKFGDAAVERKERELALEFYEEALRDRPGDVDLLIKIAELYEDLGRRSRAAGVYRKIKREFELSGATDDERYQKVTTKISRLDLLAGRYRRIKADLAGQGLALAKSYEDRKLPTMALEIARRMSASFSLPEALEYYIAVARRTGKTLARWRVAYDEQSLAGWSGDTGAYQAYGALIRANVEPDPTVGDGMITQALACDVPFDADFSLEAKMRIESDGESGYQGSLVGLCFGRKGDQNFNAVMLHPKGFMDIATNRGGIWEIHDHRSMPVGTEWRTLRIDVTGKTLDVYMDGLFVRSLGFPSRDTVSGSFGLITGLGRAAFKEIRILPRDRHDPAATIERKLAMERIHANAALRQAGSFTGIKPPALLALTWVQGKPVSLDELTGKPVMLVFWTLGQERVIPTAAYYRHLIEQADGTGLETIVVCDGSTDIAELRAQLEITALPGARVCVDDNNATLDAYYVKVGHHGMPRVLLIDRDGRVQFEGDPGLSTGVGWKPGMTTYVDAAFHKLIGG